MATGEVTAWLSQLNYPGGWANVDMRRRVYLPWPVPAMYSRSAGAKRGKHGRDVGGASMRRGTMRRGGARGVTFSCALLDRPLGAGCGWCILLPSQPVDC